MFSDAGVHSDINHLYALLKLAKQEGVTKVYVHAFLDGRDVHEKSFGKYLKEFNQKAKEIGVGEIASLNGRYYAMDRDRNYDRTEKAYRMLTLGEGFKYKSVEEAIEEAYKRGDQTDYYVQPSLIVDDNEQPIALIENKDAVIFFNFRSDRARQITYAFHAG